jgi:hypothetical protein
MIPLVDAPHLEILSKNAMTCAKLKQLHLRFFFYSHILPKKLMQKTHSLRSGRMITMLQTRYGTNYPTRLHQAGAANKKIAALQTNQT